MSAYASGIDRRSFLAGAALTSGGLAAPAIAQASRRTVRYRATADLVTLDPVATISTPAFEAAMLIYDFLFALDESLIPRPQMVDRYEQSDDGLTWRFGLRDELLFHDGEMVRARDAVASIRRWSHRDRIGMILAQRMDTMSAIDDRSFEIRLKRAFPRMLFALAAPSLTVMPDRVASTTDAAIPVKSFVGSGPFIFLTDEWVPGAKAAFRRNERYRPRPEPSSMFAGGKMAFVDRVEWSTIPAPMTAVMALLNNEIDWVYSVDTELLPTLRKNTGVTVALLNTLGNSEVLVLDTLIPPLDNAALRRALLLAVSQDDCMRAVVGDESAWIKTGVGVFAPGTPLANDIGMEVLTAPRDLDRVRRLVRESGYNGERIVAMLPADSAALFAVGTVMCRALADVGLNVDIQTTDWGTLVSRRNQVTSGNWHCHPSLNTGLNYSPATHFFLSSPYYRDEPMLKLIEGWINAPDLSSEKQIAVDIQRRFFDNPPILPLGQVYPPSAFRTTLTDIVKAPWAVFWGLRKA